MACEDCASMIYKSDTHISPFKAGVPDFCEAGCLMVQGIRVPFPTCTMHAMTSFQRTDCGTMEAQPP